MHRWRAFATDPYRTFARTKSKGDNLRLRQLALKLVLVLEVVICFVPMAVLLLLGLLLTPLQFIALEREPLLWQGPVYLVGSVVFGSFGLATMAYVLWKLLRGADAIATPELVVLGAVIGVIPIVPMAIFAEPWGWKVTAILPLVVSAHVLFLARRFVFPSRPVVIRSAAIALVPVVVAPVVLLLNPFSTSRNTIVDQQRVWASSIPNRYEYTTQLIGWLKPDDLIPRRVVVHGGEIVSATYLSDMSGRSSGEPAPRESLWTIERAFEELLDAKEEYWSVSVRFNDRWGYVERAYVENPIESLSGWNFEVRDFRVLPEPSE